LLTSAHRDAVCSFINKEMLEYEDRRITVRTKDLSQSNGQQGEVSFGFDVVHKTDLHKINQAEQQGSSKNNTS